MGMWGVFDDEGDAVADFAHQLEQKLLPAKLRRCYRLDKIITIPCGASKAQIRKKILQVAGPEAKLAYTMRHRKTCQANISTAETIACYMAKQHFIRHHIPQLTKLILLHVTGKKPSLIAGIALYLARGWHSTPIIPRYEKTVKRGYRFPSKLPKGFSPRLRKLALQATKAQLASQDEREEWRDWSKREAALRQQLRLFSSA